MAKTTWTDPDTNEPLIDDYTKQLDHFVEAFTDGHIDASELKAQEDRLTACMKEVEPTLSDEQHDAVTRLLCEMSAYMVMQYTFELQETMPKTTFRG